MQWERQNGLLFWPSIRLVAYSVPSNDRPSGMPTGQWPALTGD